MISSKTTAVREYAAHALENITAFAWFVSYAEVLTQSDTLFEGDNHKAEYQQVWFELEILNALALSQWEEDGCPVNWKAQWDSDYKQDAAHLTKTLLNLLQ
ncbi:hypothetical protein M2354_002977 [Leclercia adecarboxylata]|uniref:hypothetical protein n=1 Tax=Leclercia adecarboxylata TaxID=83655 RepID=UPI0024764BAB|nr:hypothetical protein [Leclercia adecarboxylata]MDH6163322.1 hypothetical protein [Leclercia adecarboxylata]MDU1090715.1 hypothetical protein [Leclercia adecarboxylata]MDU6818662.1 hypothetical protein [Leclercia adecarboxylata]WJT02601.1 hypothetical protein OCT50_18735 [Leclercia adecarboxylata]